MCQTKQYTIVSAKVHFKFNDIKLVFFSNPKIYAPPRKLIRNSSGGTATYEGDGKTSVQILNKELDLGLMINSFSQVGFRLNNGMMILGPMAIFPK